MGPIDLSFDCQQLQGQLSGQVDRLVPGLGLDDQTTQVVARGKPYAFGQLANDHRDRVDALIRRQSTCHV
jgi:hypothetical protein